MLGLNYGVENLSICEYHGEQDINPESQMVILVGELTPFQLQLNLLFLVGFSHCGWM